MNAKDRIFFDGWVDRAIGLVPADILLELADYVDAAPGGTTFGGDTFDAERDAARLNAQLRRVRDALEGGDWWYLRQLAAATGDPEASVSARIRDLRKPQFGRHLVESEFVSKGLWRYRLTG